MKHCITKRALFITLYLTMSCIPNLLINQNCSAKPYMERKCKINNENSSYEESCRPVWMYMLSLAAETFWRQKCRLCGHDWGKQRYHVTDQWLWLHMSWNRLKHICALVQPSLDTCSSTTSPTLEWKMSSSFCCTGIILTWSRHAVLWESHSSINNFVTIWSYLIIGVQMAWWIQNNFYCYFGSGLYFSSHATNK